MITMTHEDYLMHYGVLRRSGRYPWGSGGPEYASNASFLGYVEKLRNDGLSEKEIATAIGANTAQLRAAKTIAKNEEKQSQINLAQRLKDKGYSNVAIGQRMGINESSVRALLAPGAADRAKILDATAEVLRSQVEDKKYIDVGSGVEIGLGVSPEKLKAAVALLREEGYKLHYVNVPQVNTNHDTKTKVLTKGDVSYSELTRNRDQIRQIDESSEDGGRNFSKTVAPISVDLKRVGVRYHEDGGSDADGVIYVRPGVDDLSLGGTHYAQVRIAVNGTHYLKGMAVYKNDLPEGVDLVFNTNKSSTGNKLDAMKPLKRTYLPGDAKDKPTGPIDQDNPFGALYRQLKKLDKDGTPIEGTVRSAMNIVNDEQDWGKWSKNLSTQFLSKQSPNLAKTQLNETYERRKNQYDEIMSLTNPNVKKKMLEEFSESVDSASVHLKSAALPRQATHVILPINSLKDTEVYAPRYKNGERVVLVRHPHGGKFEIPELVVNNRNAEGRETLGNESLTVIGINSKVAARLSGADFDGDTVLVIPNNHGRVKTEPALEGLKNFDPQRAYPGYPGMPANVGKQTKMGDISNLITDMTIRGANNNELAAAVRHSMVVIDAEKHNLDVKSSYRDNGIAALKKKYQYNPKTGKAGGASTIISQAKSDAFVNERKQGYRVDPQTGAKIYRETGNSYTNSKGELVVRKTKSTRLAEAKDAHELSSGTPIENIYADHSNRLKALANQARKSSVETKNIKVDPSAKKVYANEVRDLNAKLRLAVANAPRERQARVVANATVALKKEAYPDMDSATLKKVQKQALDHARDRVGAKKTQIKLTDREWAAIQAGAIAPTKVDAILRNADMDRVKELATPKTKVTITTAKKQRAESLLSAGRTMSEVAEILGVSVSTLSAGLED